MESFNDRAGSIDVMIRHVLTSLVPDKLVGGLGKLDGVMCPPIYRISELIPHNTYPTLPSRSMAGRQALDLAIVVRIHGGQL